jgi:hypothetical protein
MLPMTAEGPVADFELEELRKQSFARGWRIKRTGDGQVTAVREDESASVTVGTVGLMKIALYNELWKPLTGRNPSASKPDEGVI